MIISFRRFYLFQTWFRQLLLLVSKAVFPLVYEYLEYRDINPIQIMINFSNNLSYCLIIFLDVVASTWKLLEGLW
jgi:hypothetical protein